MGDSEELRAEQAHVDAAYEAVEERRRRAASLAETSATRSLRTLHERDERVDASRRRQRDLELGDRPLCFGRLDFDADAAVDGVTRWYVGRMHVEDVFGLTSAAHTEDGDGDGDEPGDEHGDGVPFVVDWRAPVAEPFYRATVGDPLGVVRRRHLHCVGREVRSLDDELLGDRAGHTELNVVGEAALLRALERRRSGRMGEVAATIQADQDRAVRAPLAGVLVVQGGPGTGKTAVALHRAAYLFYAHRDVLEAKGVLVVGPNRSFIRYIERVLPSLGEEGAVYRTPASLREGVRATAQDPPDVAMAKGSAAMADVMSRAVAARERPLRKPVSIAYGAYRLTLGVKASTRIVDRVRRRPGTHNERRPHLERLVLAALHRRYVAAVDRARQAGLGPADPDASEAFTVAARRQTDVRTLLDRMWPVLTAEQTLGALYRHEPLWRDAAGDLLDASHIEAVATHHRGAVPTDVEAAPGWSPADVALLDELDVHLGSVPVRSRTRAGAEDLDWLADRVLDGVQADADVPLSQTMAAEIRERIRAERVGVAEPVRPRTVTPAFGHVVVDEAQDLSPMQWRMLARRCPSGSFTVVGDLGQASVGWQQGWDEVIDELGRPAGSAVVELVLNYRTPAEVMAVAERVLRAAAPSVSPPRSVRSTGVGPSVVRAGDDHAAVERAAQEAATLRRELSGGTVAVIAPENRLADVRAALDAEDDTKGAGRDPLDDPVVPLTPDGAKGLEFDGVIIVEPAAIASGPGGLLSLYIALTRTTDRLTIIHADPLPACLEVDPATSPARDRAGV